MMASYDFFFKARRRGMPNGSMESVSLKKVSCGGYDARARTIAQTCQRRNRRRLSLQPKGDFAYKERSTFRIVGGQHHGDDQIPRSEGDVKSQESAVGAGARYA
jgi:hypothetical protein